MKNWFWKKANTAPEVNTGVPEKGIPDKFDCLEDRLKKLHLEERDVLVTYLDQKFAAQHQQYNEMCHVVITLDGIIRNLRGELSVANGGIQTLERMMLANNPAKKKVVKKKPPKKKKAKK
ncbi:MAG: hypothetical protein WCD70_14865 [Alphaproteobacteria bacterium]